MDRRTLVAGIALWAATPQFVAAQAGWVFLGRRTVNWASGRDSIMLTPTSGPLSALSFQTRGGELLLTSIEISSGRGGRERIPVNMRLRPNVRSNMVRLRNPTSNIRRIDFMYRRVNRTGANRPTTIEVFGRR
jgi:hypothetical protein